jgi:hypothetical protein
MNKSSKGNSNEKVYANNLYTNICHHAHGPCVPGSDG